MGTHYVFRMQGEEHEGFRIGSQMYNSLIATVNHYKREKFPNLLAKNTFKPRIIEAYKIPYFKREIENAGKIILTKPLLNYHPTQNNGSLILENQLTAPQIAVRLVAAAGLCNKCKNQKEAITIGVEEGSPDHANLKLDKLIRIRELEWIYPVNAKHLFDYKMWK